MEPDFSGWATKNDLTCKDGRIIKQDAFKHNDKMRVPLVWQHQHNDPENVLGHAILENRAFGVYTYGFFNETAKGRASKQAVKHGDITGLSIFANNLTQNGPNVMHGDIKEVSLVMAGANPGAVIDNLYIRHSDGDFEENEKEAIIWTGLRLAHADSEEGIDDDEDEEYDYEDDDESEEDEDEDIQHADDSDPTLGDVYKTLNKNQKDLLHYLVGTAVEEAGEEEVAQSEENNEEDVLAHENGNKEGSTEMTRNAFESKDGDNVLAHKLSIEQINTIMADANRIGSVKESFLAHAGDYGIDDIEYLFPDAKSLTERPELLARKVEWVDKVLSSVKKSPFSKIKSIVADLTAAEARAKGFTKGNEKADEVIGLLRRTTSPTTVYKKQKLDRDDIIDITELDVIAFLKWEIRFMLDEELARAILVGDGRNAVHADKIKDPAGSTDGVGIRSILSDHDMYAHKVELAANVGSKAKITGISRARRFYRGSGNPTLYVADSTLTDMLHEEDKIGRRLYETEAALASALRVKEIVPVEVLEEYPSVVGIVVNLLDYTVGANKGGEIRFFEDFDIDFNQEKYLMETRVSGGLTRPKSALVITRSQGTLATPNAPSIDGETNTITIPSTTGIIYMIDDEAVEAGSVVITEDVVVVAVADTGYYIPSGTVTSWPFIFTE